MKKEKIEKEKESKEMQEALNNLQNVLVHLQMEKEEQIESELLVLRKELNKIKELNVKFEMENKELKGIETRCNDAEKTIRLLQEELSNKTRVIVKLQEDGKLHRFILKITIINT